MLRQHLFAAEFQSTLLQWDVNNTQVALFGQGSEGRGQNYVTEGRRKGARKQRGKDARRHGEEEARRQGRRQADKEARMQGGMVVRMQKVKEARRQGNHKRKKEQEKG